MENRFDHKDFERFVKQNADQYRMFPSEKVWNGIHHTLHARRKWYGIGLSLLLLTTAVVTWVMLLGPQGKKQPVATVVSQPGKQNIVEQKQPEPEILVVSARNHAGPDQSGTAPARSQPTNHFFASANNEFHAEPEAAAFIPVLIPTTQPQTANPAIAGARPANIRRSSPVSNRDELVRSLASQPQPRLMITRSSDADLITDQPGDKNSETAASATRTAIPGDELYPMTIESVINSYKHNRKRKNLTWQIYLVPTISYRELKENMAFIRAARSNGTIPTTTLIPDVNSVVNHKPDIGFELGFSAGYPVSKNFKVIGGLQFNVSKYDIRAFDNQSEVTTIALNSGSGANSLSTTSTYRSYGTGSQANWLRNLYFSASAPIGAEIVFNSSNKMYAGFSGTLQPTYMISNKSYLLSTDYKNYAEVPSLMRKWNLNTGFEVFAGYATKKLEWRIGPQVRYQTLSSFKDKYPVREHLFDFGLKVGVMLK